MCYGCFSKPSTSVLNSDYEHLTTKQTGCGCLLKYTLHNKKVTVLFICTVANWTDGDRNTNSGKSPSVIMKRE